LLRSKERRPKALERRIRPDETNNIQAVQARKIGEEVLMSG